MNTKEPSLCVCYSDGKLDSVNMLSISDDTSQRFEYDSLGRVTKIWGDYNGDENDECAFIDRYYTYLKNGNNETGLVESMYYTKWDYNTGEDLDLLGYSYTYDANGNITHVYKDDVLTNRYYYDSLDRLVREDNIYLDKTVVFSYDESGNILSKDEYALTFGELGTIVDTIEYEYNASCSPNAVSEFDCEEIEYDSYGNPTSYRGYTMTWKKARQLSTIADEDTSISFKYDSNGMRTQKTVNGVATDYTYVGSKLISQKTGDEVINFTYSGLGEAYAFSYNGTHYFYLNNLQGDVIGLYDVYGNIVVEYTYDAWGNTISITGSLADTVGVKNPLRYRGYYYDTETGLYYLQSRYYDPETTRFLNMDKYFIAGDYINGMNMYAYCLNNPVMYVDPSGKSSEQIAIDVAVMFSYLAVFAELIENGKIDKEAFFDFISRVTTQNTTLGGFNDALEIGYNIFVGKDWSEAISGIGTIVDVLDLLDIGLPSAVSGIASGVVLLKDILVDVFNPSLTTDVVWDNSLGYITTTLMGAGYSAMSAKVIVAISVANLPAGAVTAVVLFVIGLYTF